MNFVIEVVKNVLGSLYELTGFSLIVAVLFMFVFLEARKYGWKILAQEWLDSFKMHLFFRRAFFLAFYTTMILFRTLFCRYIWLNPLSNVIGTWGLYNENGELTTEVIENLVLFIPFIILLLGGSLYG